MSIIKLLDMIYKNLPADITSNELFPESKKEFLTQYGKNGLYYILQNCKRLNWESYLQNNPDVKEFNIDPVRHYIDFGIYEDRKLYSWHPCHKPPTPNSPKISVIVPNHNNAIFIRKCLESLIGQTLKNIEIIIVDDASTDSSCHIVEEYANKDKRIRLIKHTENRGTHVARKTGVNAANGEYVMFLDGDDYYSPKACETALNAILKGFDIASFNINVIGHGKIRQRDINYFDKMFNALDEGEYSVSEIMKIAFIEKKMAHNVWSKIYLKNLVKLSFAEMEDSSLVFAEDLYEFMSIVSNSRNLIKISDRLYNYSLNMGITSLNDYSKQVEIIRERQRSLDAIENLCKIKGLNLYNKKICERLQRDSFLMLPSIPDEMVTEYFNEFCDTLGPLNTSIGMMNAFHNNWDKVSTKLRHYNKKIINKAGKKKIGIYYYRISGGGIETTMLNMIRVLQQHNYDVSLILEEMLDEKKEAELGVPVYYLTPSGSGQMAITKHLISWNSIIKTTGLDVVFYMWVHEPLFFWDNLLLQLLGIGVIGSLRFDHNLEMLYRGRNYRHLSFLNTLRTIDKLFCLSISSEIYLRSQDIDAVYIPNTVRKMPEKAAGNVHANNIACIGRMHDNKKQMTQTLLILREVIKEIADARIIYIGGFEDADKERIFRERIKQYGLEKNVTLAGWTDTPHIFLDQCKVFLYTSFMEGFPNGLAEAQKRGLPGVMYYLDIMMAENNPSIIQVQQGAIKEAAANLIKLLKNENLRLSLSQIAASQSAIFTEQRFGKEIVDLLETYDKISSFRPYTAREYNKVIKSMAFYAGKNVPPFEIKTA